MQRAAPNAVAHYTTLFLVFGGRWLLLRRAASKRFSPGRYTGLGGRVEADELGDLRSSVLRELLEETGLGEEALEHLSLRRLLIHNRPGEPLTALFYFTAALRRYALPSCTEGTLEWVASADFRAPDMTRDIIETTAQVLPRLAQDVAEAPAGTETVQLGVAHYGPDGRFRGVTWGP